MARMRRREFIAYLGAMAAVPLAALREAQGGNANMTVPVVRISLGTFDADKAAIVEAKLMQSKATLEAGIRAMRGNLGYYVGVDCKNNAMSNISLWESVEAAEQMAIFQPMLDLAKSFVALGVRFQRPILNMTTLWELP
jgi:quinol monooxygenase YgiN